MPLKTATTNAALWMVISIAWLIQSRPYHPSATLWIGSTVLLMAGSVVGERLSTKRSPRQPVMWVAYWISCGVLTAAAIYVLYNVFHGPDPRRFPFSLNCVMDSFIVAVNSLIVMGGRWVVGRSSK